MTKTRYPHKYRVLRLTFTNGKEINAVIPADVITEDDTGVALKDVQLTQTREFPEGMSWGEEGL